MDAKKLAAGVARRFRAGKTPLSQCIADAITAAYLKGVHHGAFSEWTRAIEHGVTRAVTSEASNSALSRAYDDTKAYYARRYSR